MLLEDLTKIILYSLLILLIPKDVKRLKVYNINTNRYKISIVDKEIDHFIIIRTNLDKIIT